MVRGGIWEGGGRKKALKALEKWPLALKASPGGLGKIRPNKRLQDTQEGKEVMIRRVVRQEGRKESRVLGHSQSPLRGLCLGSNAWAPHTIHILSIHS